MIDYLIIFLIIFGVLFILVGSIALLRFPDFYTRTHGPTKATTLGVSGIILASLVYMYSIGKVGVIKELLVIFFLFLTAPAAAHMMAKAGVGKKISRLESTVDEKM